MFRQVGAVVPTDGLQEVGQEGQVRVRLDCSAANEHGRYQANPVLDWDAGEGGVVRDGSWNARRGTVAGQAGPPPSHMLSLVRGVWIRN